ncbi:hypothetical protein FRB90_010704 [Tulasnella sp. 427]|nr:hypothetical protein FRB90_010704 [Tulasnella sp. 427]
MRSSKQTSGAKLLSILIRDSFLWYFSLAGCLLVNAVAWTTSTPILVLIGLPVLNSASTIGGSRLLLNLRAAYFVKDPKSGPDGFRFEKTTDFVDTEVTVVRRSPTRKLDHGGGWSWMAVAKHLHDPGQLEHYGSPPRH